MRLEDILTTEELVEYGRYREFIAAETPWDEESYDPDNEFIGNRDRDLYGI